MRFEIVPYEAPKSKKKNRPAVVSEKPLPGYLLPLQEKYSHFEKVTLADISPEDLEQVFEAYGADMSLDVVGISRIFNVSSRTFYHWLKTEPDLQEYYSLIKSCRSHLAMVQGYTVLQDTYKAATEGEASREQVQAARALSSFLMEYSQFISPEGKKNNQEAPVSITLSLPSTPFNTGYTDVTHNDSQ